MELHGNFDVKRASFASEKVQQALTQLSLRGQGQPEDLKTANPMHTVSNFGGDFKITQGILSIPNLQFTVPGAALQFKGNYTFDGGALQFEGNAKLHAHASQMMSGWKGKLLTIIDPVLSREGAGTYIPVHVTGTRDNPHIAVDFGKLLKP